MKRNNIMFALCLTGSLGLTRLALSQETTTRNTTEVSDDGLTKTTTKTTMVDGTVVRYERGKTIVVRGSDDREVTYTLAPNVTGAGDVEIGRHVSLTTDPGDGATLVTRITTQSLTPEGNLKTEVRTDSAKAGGGTTSSKTTTVTGKVTLIDPGHTVTLTLPNRETVEYVMDSSSVVPKDLAIGKTVTLYTTSNASDGPLTVKKITTKTTTRTKTTTTTTKK